MKHINLDKLDRIFPNAYFELYHGIVEPGYDDTPLLVADWNNVPSVVFDRIESLGYTCEFFDEWTSCSECSKAVRTTGNCWGWQQAYYIFNDCELVCLDCLDPVEYFESLENNSRSAVTSTILRKYDPADYGYELVQDDYENGFHRHQTDNPSKILAEAQKNDPGARFLFAMTSQGQFDVQFALYRKIELNSIKSPQACDVHNKPQVAIGN